LVTFVAFMLLALTPGDPAKMVAGELASPEQVAQVREQLGLDRPLPSRYVTFLGDALHGDLGQSLTVSPRNSVAELLTEAAPVTLSIVAVTMLFAIVFGVTGGVLAARYSGRTVDHLVTGTAALAISVPTFVVGPVVVGLIAVDHGWLPAGGYVPLGDGLFQWFKHLILPGLVLALYPAAELARYVRSTMVDALDQTYVRTAHSMGVPVRRIMFNHAGKNAAIPVVTVLGLQVGALLGGAVIVETVFAMPGLGTLAINAVLSHDLPVVQGIVLVTGFVVIMINLLVEFTYGFFNPKLRT
jgi:peptide/nickel transport system permease protein